ncbi:hypothetical protein EV360DRAFT_88992 [Lentinula raphanica]|nr:hypothetical protein EV360DRAFT_88992 [Lentinula raphanica]
MGPSLNTRVQSTLSSLRPYFTDSASRLTRRSSSLSWFPHDVQIARHNPDIRVLNALHREMQEFIQQGQLASFSKDDFAWVLWHAPIWSLVSGAMTTVAPPSYVGIPGYKGPVCPHILNLFLSIEECTMVVKTSRVRGMNQYVFLAPHPGCKFQMKIPYFGHQKIEAEQYSDDDERDEIDLMYSAYLSSSQSSCASAQEVEDSLLLEMRSSSAMLHDSGSSSVSSSISSFSSQGSSASVQRPKPVPMTPAQARSLSYYSKEQAEKRAAYDKDLVADISLAFSQGIFRDFPRFHPAYDLCAAPLATLAPYDPATNNGAATFIQRERGPRRSSTFSPSVKLVQSVCASIHLTALLHTLKMVRVAQGAVTPLDVPQVRNIHRALRDFRSNINVRNVSAPDLPVIEVDESRLLLRTFKEGQRPAFRDDSDSSLGRPWLEWNSKLGIPVDVWTVIHTAVIVCTTCHLVRTFNADRSHRSSNGDCMDPGQTLEDDQPDSLGEDSPLSPSKGKQVV